ncbi:MAG: carboxymuconolactone decarboxylase family protein [Acidimicrobiales bacterium]
MTAPRTYDERHAAALEVLDGFLGGRGDPARVARSMQRRHGPLGDFGIDVVLGDIWARPELSRRDRSLIVVSVLGALGSSDELAWHTQVGLNHGLTRTEIDEALLHVAVYAGFPMAMQASRIVDECLRSLDGVDRLPERPKSARQGDAERRAAACDVRQTITGGRTSSEPAEDFDDVVARIGEVGRVMYPWAFGDVWARPELGRRDRSLIVIALLTALSREDELSFHIPAGLNHGLSRAEVEEIMVQLTIYAGVPRAIGGALAMRQVFADLDAPGDG